MRNRSEGGGKGGISAPFARALKSQLSSLYYNIVVAFVFIRRSSALLLYLFASEILLVSQIAGKISFISQHLSFFLFLTW